MAKRIKDVTASIVCAVTIMLSMYGCSYDKIRHIPQSQHEKLVLTADIVSTKTALDGGKVLWTAGDRICVNGSVSEPLGRENDGVSTASFVLSGVQSGPFCALYPASIYKDYSTITLPQEQLYDASSFSADASPMLAYQTEGSTLSFSHPCAVLKFSLKDGGHAHAVRYVEFSGNDGEQVCGDFAVDYSSCSLTPSGLAGSGRTVRVYPNRSLTESETLVHVVIPAGEYPKGYTVKVVDEKGHFMSLSTSARTVEKGVVYEMPVKEFTPSGTIVGAETSASDVLRILGVGNSWTRDSMRWLSAIAMSAGRPVIVGHGYLGGSTLKDQYLGIDDTEYTYVHSGKNQVVHDTYQYWKYDGTESPVKTPSDDEGYNNGLGGIGVTLESVVNDEPWDIVVFQPNVIVRDHFPEYGFDINDLVARVKAMMPEDVASSVKCGLMVPFSYASGTTDYRQTVVDTYNDGMWPASQAEWDELYEHMHRTIQTDIDKLAAHMGDNCRFIINVGQAICEARQNPRLSHFGYGLQRAQNNTHLAEGMPMYIASLCYAYELLNIRCGEASFYPATSSVVDVSGKSSTVSNTPTQADQARMEAWRATCK